MSGCCTTQPTISAWQSLKYRNSCCVVTLGHLYVWCERFDPFHYTLRCYLTKCSWCHCFQCLGGNQVMKQCANLCCPLPINIHIQDSVPCTKNNLGNHNRGAATTAPQKGMPRKNLRKQCAMKYLVYSFLVFALHWLALMYICIAASVLVCLHHTKQSTHGPQTLCVANALSSPNHFRNKNQGSTPDC